MKAKRYGNFLASLLYGCLLLTSASAAPRSQSCDEVQRLLQRAVEAGQTRLTLPKRTFCLTKPISIDGVKNLTIEGNGATLLVARPVEAVRIGGRSQAITLRNLTIDYDPLPFTQGHVTSLVGDNATFRLDEGYPAISSLGAINHAYLFEPTTREWKAGYSAIYPIEVRVSKGGRSGTMVLSPKRKGRPAVGDLVAFNMRRSAAIRIDGLAADTRLENVGILSSPGMGVLARHVEGELYLRLTIARGPPPAGAQTGRLLSTNADGVNVAHARARTVIERSSFSFEGDDAVNLHGLTLPVVAYEGPASLLLARPSKVAVRVDELLQPGDPVRLLRPGDFRIVGSAIVKKAAQVERDQSLSAGDLRRLFPMVRPERFQDWTYYRVEFQEKISPVPGAFVDFPALATPDFLIQNSHFHDNRGRAMKIQAIRGRVINNHVERVTLNGISVGPLYSPWREAGWVSDVEIVNNSIERVCLDPDVQNRIEWQGAISVSATVDEAGSNSGTGNEQVRIEGNRLSDCWGSEIVINATAHAFVTGNTIRTAGALRPAGVRTSPLVPAGVEAARAR